MKSKERTLTECKSKERTLTECLDSIGTDSFILMSSDYLDDNEFVMFDNVKLQLYLIQLPDGCINEENKHECSITPYYISAPDLFSHWWIVSLCSNCNSNLLKLVKECYH